MNTIYIFSGLGVDQRVFDNIDFGTLDVVFIDWIPPHINEPIQDYAKRISEKITSKNPTLIGLSFGGILCVELSKIIQTKQILLIASAKTKFELPTMYRLLGKLKINKILPASVLKKHNFLSNWMFGLESESEKELLKDILKDTDSYFLKWAINEILNWTNTTAPQNHVHIHGNKDRIIPLKNVNSNFIIDQGGHFMTVNKAAEIETIIKKSLGISAF